MTNSRIEGFHEPITVGEGAIKLPVYVSDAGTKPLVVLHELPGMTPSFIEFCQCMAKREFKVHMPLIFESPGTEMRSWRLRRFCLSREFHDLFSARRGGPPGRPFTAWLIELVGWVTSEHPGAKVGVVGMCLTGSFAIAAIAVPGVAAAVVCQPAFPVFFGIKTLGLSPQEREAAVARAGSLPKPCAKGYRFKWDFISRRGHMRAVEAALGDAFERYPDLPGYSHSTLTSESRSLSVFRDVQKIPERPHVRRARAACGGSPRA